MKQPALRNAINKATLALIDADDTLWLNACYYPKFVEQIVATILNLSSVPERQLRSSLAHYTSLADPGELGFANAVLKCVENMCGGLKPANEISGYVRYFVEHPLHLLADAEIAIRSLPCRLKVLYTKGVMAEQMRKVIVSGVSKWFDEVVITQRKDAESLATMLRDRQIAPSEGLVIGNNVKHDIVPAITVGASAIWLNHPKNTIGSNCELPRGAVEVRAWRDIRLAIGDEKLR